MTLSPPNNELLLLRAERNKIRQKITYRKTHGTVSAEKLAEREQKRLERADAKRKANDLEVHDLTVRLAEVLAKIEGFRPSRIIVEEATIESKNVIEPASSEDAQVHD